MSPANLERLHAIYQTVERHPGSTVNEIARRLDLNYSQVVGSLPTLENHGLLLSEDDRRRLYACGRINVGDRMHRNGERIRQMHAAGLSIRDICQRLFGNAGGQTRERLSRLVPN